MHARPNASSLFMSLSLASACALAGCGGSDAAPPAGQGGGSNGAGGHSATQSSTSASSGGASASSTHSSTTSTASAGGAGGAGAGGGTPGACTPPTDMYNPIAKLSDTGCMDPNTPTKVASFAIPYEVNSPLWSDSADKTRA